MKRRITRTTLIALCAAAIFVMPSWTRAQDSTNIPAVATPMPHKKHAILFRGAVTALDTNAMTLSVSSPSMSNFTLYVNSTTKITKDGQPATFADGAVGETVSGSYRMAANGTNNAVSIHYGPTKKNQSTNSSSN